ncbi:indole-3-glycerol phosphate synthase TrpC [Arthrobacter castelli]|uniref:indole-3-glycerol phosphate synthase TrpC n=1 Tax=Arthrobacter castelli TaxID=271431 RepID=UPI000407199A|nr:indole-3-glycerol phosphate synthase TrpC [Arthrobacter castelli]
MSVLDDIIEGVKEDLQERKSAVNTLQLRDIVATQPPAKDAYAALGGADDPRSRLRVIAEVKRKSPSKGELADIGDPAVLAGRYEAGGAAVISVLTEQRRFGGSLEDLDAVRATVDTPLLRKDFTVDAYQVLEARAHGADLILLIVAALSDAQLAELMGLSHELGMNVLVEAHTVEEVERAAAAGARIIGVNVRNLKTLELDRSVFSPLAAAVPPGTLIVAESGVRDVGDVEQYAAQGANAILVGEALVKHNSPTESVEAFSRAGAAVIAQKTAEGATHD